MKKIFLYTIVAGLTLTACKLDDNMDPNVPLTEDLTPRLQLTAAETSLFAAQSNHMFSLSKIWTNTVAGNFYQYAAPMTAEYQMNITSSSNYGNIWNNNYLALANSAKIINSKDAAKFPLHVAIAKILMANGMQYIVDFYGDAPYSEAFKEQNNLNPKYDKGQDIYKDLIIKLNEAIVAIGKYAPQNATVDEAIAVTASEDVIFHGQMTEWKKLANTIKLRLLLRQSKLNDSFVNEQLASLSTLSPTSDFVNSNVTINPGFSVATEQQLNPLFLNFGSYNYTATAQNLPGYVYYKASDHIAKLVEGDVSKPTSGVKDPRRAAMFRTVTASLNGTIPAQVVGIEQGQTRMDGTTTAMYSFQRDWMYDTTTQPGEALTAAVIVRNGGTRDGYIMLKSEAELLLAEAAVLYPQYFSNAQAHYNNAVTESFTFYNLTASPTAYLAALDSKSVGWSGAPNKIAAIQYQRLIILNNYKPYETYINYLKTGYPETPLATTALYPNKPYRLPYPISEFIGNSANVPKLTEAEMFTKNQYTPFWNRN